MKAKNWMRIILFLGYSFLVIFAIVHSSLPSSISSKESDRFSYFVESFINFFFKEQTNIIETESVTITNKASFDEEYLVGNSVSLNVETLPKDATHKSNVYSSSDSSVASVDNHGKISFVGEGEVTISVNNSYYTELSDSVSFKVTRPKLEKLTIAYYLNSAGNDKTYTLDLYHRHGFVVATFPTNSKADVTWSLIQDDEYVTFDESYEASKPTSNAVVIVPKKVSGDNLITLKTTCGEIEAQVYLKIEDTAGYIENPTNIEKINFKNITEDFSLIRGDLFSLPTENYPSFARGDIRYRIDVDDSTPTGNVIAQNLAGDFYANMIGKYKITAYVRDNPSISCSVNIEVKNMIVEPEIESDFLDSSLEGKLIAGKSYSLKVKISDKATYIDYKITSSDTNVATVGKDGVITTLKSGFCTIKIVIDDGFSDSKSINISLKIFRDSIKNIDEFLLLIRKGAGHFSLFLMIGLWGFLAYRSVMNSSLSFSVSILSGVFIASLTETIQLFVEGRYGSVDDVLLDSAGTIFGVLLVLLALQAFYKIRLIIQKIKHDKSA